MVPSAGPSILRTHVRMEHSLPAHATSAPVDRPVALPGPLVPAARGRLRRRLGGRPGRARPGRHAWAGGCSHRAPSVSSAAACGVRSATTRPAGPGVTLLRVPGQPGDIGAPGKGGAREYKKFGLRITMVRRSPKSLLYVLFTLEKTGGVLLSQALASQVPSALRGLTALFGMGRGVSPSQKPPEKGERPRSLGPSKLHSATTGTTLITRIKKNPSSPRPISTGLLQTLPSFQIRPINLVVYQGSYSL